MKKGKYNIIALTAPKTTGKTTLAKRIKERMTNCSIISFADPLKKIADLFFDEMHMTTHKEDHFEPAGMSYRQMMIAIGDALRLQNEDVFVDILEAKIREAPEGWTFIIDDLRFFNEAQWVRRVGGKIVRLHRNNINYTMSHGTEKPLPYWILDYEGDPDGTFDMIISGKI